MFNSIRLLSTLASALIYCLAVAIPTCMYDLAGGYLQLSAGLYHEPLSQLLC